MIKTFALLPKRALSMFFGLALLAFLVGSSLFVSAESDHDCSGDECPVCAEIQICLNSMNVVGEPVANTSVIASAGIILADVSAPRAFEPPATTLRSLDVRWNE